MPSGLTPKNIEEKKSHLIQNAVGILEDEGMEALTLRHLAKVSDVSRTTPYLYYENKAALMDAMRVYGINLLTSQCEHAISKEDQYVEQLRLLGDCYVRFALRHPELYQLIFVSGLPNTAMSSELSLAIERYSQITETPMQMAYDDGVVSLPPERLNPVLWSALHGLLTLNSAGLVGDKKSFDQLRSDLEQILAMGFVKNRS